MTSSHNANLGPKTGAPLVSIGVPVYNGDHFVGRTLASLAAQTLTDFEVVISDNGSTDGTERICRDYAARDPRFKYYRVERNQGVVFNFNRCIELTTGKYFKWQAADDLMAPTYLEECVKVLEADPEVVIAFPRTVIIDEDDQKIRDNTYDVSADVPYAHVRFRRLMCLDHRKHGAHELYGLIRRRALDRLPWYGKFARTDSVLLTRLGLLGRFRRVEEPLFLNREHTRRSVRLVPGARTMSPRGWLAGWIGSGPVPPVEWWDPSQKGRITFPEWRLLAEYMGSLKYARLSPAQRFGCSLSLAWFTLRHSPKLLRDLLIAVEQFVGRSFEQTRDVANPTVKTDSL